MAKCVLAAILSLAIVIHQIGRLIGQVRGPRPERPFRVVMIGTFYNVGWLAAHATPLARCDAVEEVLVVCDAPLGLQLSGMRYECPSAKLVSGFGRSLARVITLFRVAYQFHPQVFMGYHIMPNGPLALIMARLFGGHAIYQMTGGPIQLVGGGYQSENMLLAATETPSKILEFLMYSMVRCFDAIVVRGTSAQKFIRDGSLNPTTYLITGAIDVNRFAPVDKVKDLDVVYVSRLVPNKGVEHCIAVAGMLARMNTNIRIAIVGGGPLEAQFKELAEEYGVIDSILFCGQQDDVVPILQRGKIYLLLSPSEGMSIAMLEAMATGLAVVVTDVGDLSDVFRTRPVGKLIEALDIESISAEVNGMLSDQSTLSLMASNARQEILENYSVSAITERWKVIFTSLSSNGT